MTSGMWSLFMGTAEVSEGEQESPAKQNNVLPSINDGLESLHSTKIISNMESAALHGKTKHRIPSPTREQGDGMEAEDSARSTNAKVTVEVKSSKAAQSKQLITLPQTNVKVDKLPPIAADREIRLPAFTPSSPLVEMAVSPPKIEGLKKQHKEPKFVPYEPYKAAVTSMVPQKSQRHKRSVSNTSSITGVPVDTSLKSSEELTRQDALSPSVKSQVHEDGLLLKMLDESKEKIAKLQKCLSESEKQLRIQTQVNTEVKKLLVASVGEDIEAKVDYLTQDKARLAADIRQYSNKIYNDFEEKEKLSVESDLWKSKFLACSVIVDELAHWKASLLNRSDDVNHHVRLLLHERAMLWDNLDKTTATLNQIKIAFNPLAKKDSDPQVASVLTMAEWTLQLAQELNERLLGKDQRTKVPSAKRDKMDTPAEEGLKNLMATKLEGPSSGEDISSRASAAVTGAARPHLAKINDKLSSPNIYSSQFKCCTHCTGTVHVV